MLSDIIGHVVIVMAPTGSGKGTIIRYAQSGFPDLKVTISCTTRAMRPMEIDGRDYHFIDSVEFDRKIQAGDFLEWATFGLNRYGTLKSEILPYLHTKTIVIAEIEVQGVKQLHALLPAKNITTVYIEAGGWETLRQRALARSTITAAELSKRYERYLVEIASKKIADVIIDNSGSDSTPAKKQFADLIESMYTKMV